jgi:hypothetical protein
MRVCCPCQVHMARKKKDARETERTKKTEGIQDKRVKTFNARMVELINHRERGD